MHCRITKLIFLLLLSVGLQGYAQQVFQGRVLDSETGKPIPFASIGIVGTSKGTSTNVNGEFSLAIEGKVAVKITCVGYESVQLTSLEFIEEIQLTPKAIQLKDVVVFSKGLHPEKIVRKALLSIPQNFPRQSIFQTFFYRHYCQDDGKYGRLIEAFVDVWRQNGYREFRPAAGHHEELKVVQLRRSLDHTAVSQSHEPLDVDNILLADMAAYQTADEYMRLDFYGGVNNLKTDIADYDFNFGGLTHYDGEEVFEIKFSYPNKPQENAGRNPAKLTGSLFLTTDHYAIVRFEETRYKGNDTIRTSAFYQKYGNKYMPYRLIRDGGTYASGKKVHWYHIELMSVEISEDPKKRFEGTIPGKEELLSIKYDPNYWQQHSVLTATPLEQQILADLGGGKSLDQQFELYQQYEMNTTNGGVDGEKKLQWLTEFSKNQKPLVLCYWQGDYMKSAVVLEKFKQLNKKFRGLATFAMVSLDENQTSWSETVQKYGLAFDGMLQFRIGNKKQGNHLPTFQLISQQASLSDVPENRLEKEIEILLKAGSE